MQKRYKAIRAYMIMSAGTRTECIVVIFNVAE